MRNSAIIISTLFFAFSSLPLWGQMATLNDAEKKEILFLLEEEKMARDVYATLGEKWDRQVFQNIQSAEEHHQEMVIQVAKEFNLVIPPAVLTNNHGQFENPQLQTMYQQLVASGQTSLVEALKAGAKIEELDIRDLQNALENTSNPQLIQLYSRLIKASENHLRAFTKNLSREGVDYQPIVLESSRFDQIIGGEKTKGSGCYAGNEKDKTSCKGEKTSCEGAKKGKGEKSESCCQSSGKRK